MFLMGTVEPTEDAYTSGDNTSACGVCQQLDQKVLPLMVLQQIYPSFQQLLLLLLSLEQALLQLPTETKQKIV